MKRNILIIEDKEPHLKALCKILNELPNVTIFKACNIAEAYYVLSLNYIHLFLVDIVLEPDDGLDTSGLDFVRELRENKKYQFIPVIFVTSLEDPKLLSYTQLRCFGYIEKPYDEKQITELVSKALEFPIKALEDKIVYFRKDGIIYSLHNKCIVYVEVTGRKARIVCIEDILTFPYLTINDSMKKLDNTLFIQCNRNTLVNRELVQYMDHVNRYIKMSGFDEKIEVGRKFAKRLKDVFKND